ncbi:hypothetical protein GN244_ATG20031 [Phytophthora infestans]|uniref:Uncharacterized protein n=1 Tax=Phytophthora infestans TaxID=4787 RepID=A0A833WCG9_PHYIN|nr:hypothetical protein GN244_ATG20031 [Phytophthora infestans]KAF4137261.1 hypothetical protein GN958_ATG13524 [Phytophthora infestans]
MLALPPPTKTLPSPHGDATAAAHRDADTAAAHVGDNATATAADRDASSRLWGAAVLDVQPVGIRPSVDLRRDTPASPENP